MRGERSNQMEMTVIMSCHDPCGRELCRCCSCSYKSNFLLCFPKNVNRLEYCTSINPLPQCAYYTKFSYKCPQLNVEPSVRCIGNFMIESERGSKL
jgi:hypothetical protein